MQIQSDRYVFDDSDTVALPIGFIFNSKLTVSGHRHLQPLIAEVQLCNYFKYSVNAFFFSPGLSERNGCATTPYREECLRALPECVRRLQAGTEVRETGFMAPVVARLTAREPMESEGNSSRTKRQLGLVWNVCFPKVNGPVPDFDPPPPLTN